ncbi:MAG: motility associated factor glycosyltransferase family protein [Spirochaetota bacterium]
MNKPLDHNLVFLREHFPALCRRLEEHRSRGPGNPESSPLVYTAHPHPNILAGAMSLHARSDPRKEAARFLAGLQPREGVLLLFLGLGLGYQVEELRWRCGGTFGGATVVVVERSMESFSLLASHRDLSFLRGAELMVGEETGRVLSRLEELCPGRFSGYRIIRLRGACGLFPGYYGHIEERFRRLMGGRLSDLLTRFAFESLWMRNVIDNTPFLVGRSSILPLQGALRGSPALVLGAGPSLDSQLDLLRGAPDALPLIAVDTVLSPLLASGVHPHLVVTLDGQWHSLGDFTRAFTGGDGGGGESSVLVADVVSCPQVVKRWSGPLCFSQSAQKVTQGSKAQDHPLPGLLAREHPVPALACGGSVATTAVELALYLEADPVLVAGLDLAFTGYLTHLRGTPFDRAARLEATRLRPFPTPAVDAIRRRRTRKLPALDGGVVVSDFVLHNYLRWFQSREGYRGRVFNASAGGAAVPGLVRVDLGRTLRDARDAGQQGARRASLQRAARSGRELTRGEAAGFLTGLRSGVQRALRRLGEGADAEGVATEVPFLAQAAAALSSVHRDQRAASGKLQELLVYLGRRVDRALERLG